jgi:methylated-DNA-[protein]-cysteine S-methyltransferase
MAVWRTLLNIPYGKTMTYGEIAARVASSSEGVRMSAQAVGGAVGHNPISLIIPCHRVLGADGKLTGYAGGLDRKSRLLQMEKTAVFGKSGTFRPQNL